MSRSRKHRRSFRTLLRSGKNPSRHTRPERTHGLIEARPHPTQVASLDSASF